MTEPPDSSSQVIPQQAALWLARRHSGAWTRGDRLELETWLNADPSHRRAYEQLTWMWGDLDGIKTGIDDLRHAARRYRAVRGVRLVWRRFAVPGLAVFLLLAAATAHWHWIGIATRHVTAIGEMQDITLADGSNLRLNTDSEIKVRIGANRREVELQRGEALFTVAHDAARPFVVRAGAGSIQDLGTRFAVYVQPDRVEVSVLQGKVKIKNNHGDTAPFATLAAGEATAYDARGLPVPGFAGDVEAATAWLDGTVVFKDLPLPQVTAQLSRYHPVRFELQGRRLANIKISGRFQAGNLALLLKTLQASFPIEITRIDASHIRFQAR